MPEKKKKAAPKAKGFSAEERAAMKERARELKGTGDGEADLRAKLSAMAPAERAIGERIHALVKEHAPMLSPKTWYGMPAWANADGQVVCFFQDGRKFKTRYCTLGFSDKARLDDGQMWPNAYALLSLTPADEARVVTLLKKAVG